MCLSLSVLVLFFGKRGFRFTDSGSFLEGDVDFFDAWKFGKDIRDCAGAAFAHHSFNVDDLFFEHIYSPLLITFLLNRRSLKALRTTVTEDIDMAIEPYIGCMMTYGYKTPAARGIRRML